MNPQLSAILAFLIAVVFIGGGYSLLHSGHAAQDSLPPGADAATYEKLCATGESAASCAYAKDKNWVYFGNSIVPGADAATFVLIDRYYAKDKNHVYYSSHGSLMPEIVPGDPSTFKNLGGDGLYTLDQTSVYWENTPIPNADPSTFVELYVGSTATVYGKDATTVYHAGTIIQNADPNTFHIIQISSTGTSGGADGYAADATTVYYDGSTIPGANPNTFVPPGTVTTVVSGTMSSTTTTTTSTPTSTPQTTTAPATTTPTSQTSQTTQTSQTSGGFLDLFTGFTLYTTPSGSTNAYFNPSATVKNPNGF